MNPPSQNRPERTLEYRPRRKGVVLRIVDAVGSIPFGVTVLFLIFVYCWLGSAGTQPVAPYFIRQLPGIEKTEMEWFSWWPFTTLLALLCTAVAIISFRRIPRTLPYLGVWTVHLGILVLCTGSAVYFGRKSEGDLHVYRREAVVSLGETEVTLPLRLHERVEIEDGGRRYTVSVIDLNPAYSLRTGEDDGKQTYAVHFLIDPPDRAGDPGDPFVRQVLVGYPQYTEDVIPGEGRAVKVLGEAIVDPDLTIRLEYAPKDRMYLVDRPAVYARSTPSAEWTEFPIRGLPRYHEHIGRLEDIIVSPGDPVPPARPLDLPLRRKERPDSDLSLSVTGFLPYATLVDFLEPGGTTLRPYLRFTMSASERGESTHELFALDGTRNRIDLEGVEVTFDWVEMQKELDRYLDPGTPSLRVTVHSAVNREVSHEEPAPIGGKGPQALVRTIPLVDCFQHEVSVPSTGYTIRGVQYFPRWRLESGSHRNEVVSNVLLEVTDPGGRVFRRSVVFPHAELSQDLDEEGNRHAELLDEDLSIELLNPVESGVRFIAGPVGTHAILTSQDGEVTHREVTVGEPFQFLHGASPVFTVDQLIDRPRRIVKPVTIPRSERNPKMRGGQSLIRVTASRGAWNASQWVEFSRYPHPNRFGYFPTRLALPDGAPVELLYSRESVPLGERVVLEDFNLVTYPGKTRERDYVSHVRFETPEGWSPELVVKSNHPTRYGRWWFFQKEWDPPAPARNDAGMNYTGLGVGNRRGVRVMLLGAAMTVLGTLYAFYVKPILLRRRRTSRRHLETTASGGQGETVSRRTRTPVAP